MLPLRASYLLILMTSLLGAVNSEASNPLKDPNICGFAKCEIENEKFGFSQNSVYRYSLESSQLSLFDGTDNNDPLSQVFISGFAEITFPTKCQGELKLSGIKLKHKNVTLPDEISEKSSIGDIVYDDDEDTPATVQTNLNEEFLENVLHPRSAKFAEDLEKFELRFDFHDGEINEICPQSSESVWITNFKRGIISTLQNTMLRFDLDHTVVETDISGKCEVNYEFAGSDKTSILVKKTKSLSSCQNRNKFKSFLQTTPYEFRRSDISWWPIYNSTSYCILSIDNYIYNSIECHDHHVLIPFSNGHSGAATKSSLSLRFISDDQPREDGDGNAEKSIEKRVSLLYDHSFSPKPTHHEIKVSRDYLRQMCTLGFPNIQREFPDRFVKFLGATRHLNSKGLNLLLSRAHGICDNGRKHVLESLPFIESPASIEIMKDLIIGDTRDLEITDETVEKWMNAIFYLPRPDESTMRTMLDFVKFHEAKPENGKPFFILIPTSVTHTFCNSHSNCRSVEVVMEIVDFLEKMAARNLEGDLNDKTTYEKAIVALKGLGNIGVITQTFESYLKNQIVNEELIEDVKIQIVEVFRKTDCDRTREFFVDIYQNFTQTVELRVASYLQLMKCPTYKTIKNIRDFLPKEQVNQVASFVWSHLTNLAKTSSPQKIEMQGLLADSGADVKPSFDFRKFSKNYEYSLFFEEYNFGVSGESNVIFGTESFLPRFVQFNGTINLFGNSLNPLEFALRIRGMEKYIESIFGLNGPLNLEKLLDKFGFIFEKLKNMFNVEDDVIETILRSRRSADDNLIDGIAYQPKYDFNKPIGYFEHKIFGNDVNFYRFESFNELSDIIKKIVPIEQMKGIFSRKEEILMQSGTLIDVSYTVPLISGFPLVLSAFGAYSLDLRYFASIDNLSPQSVNFIGKMKPALSMELSTKMQIDMFHATTDVRVKSNIYSNYAVETELKLDNGEKLTLNMKLPQDRNDIFSVQTKLMSNIEDEDTILYGITNRYKNSTCSWPSVNEKLGLKVCVDYLLPDVNDVSRGYPSLVLSGPISFDIHLDKADLSAKLYNFVYKWIKHNKDSSTVSITFETPETEIPRKFSAQLKIDQQKYDLSMGFINGPETQTALGVIKWTPDDKAANFSLMVNDREHFRIETSLKRIVQSKSKVKFLPLFALTINDQKIAGMNGIVKTISKNNVAQHDIDLRFETKKMLATANGQFVKTQASFMTKMAYTYQFKGKREETIEIDTELANRSQKSRGRTEYNGIFKFVSSAYSNYNFASGFTFLSSLGHVETKIEINNAEDLIDPAYTLTTTFTLAKSSDDSHNSRTIFAVEAKRPKSSTDVKFQVTYDEKLRNGVVHNVEVLLRYATEKEVHARGVVWMPQGQLFGLDANFSMVVPDMNKCFGSLRIRERIKRDYNFEITGEWFSGENIRSQGLYQDRTSNTKKFHRLKTIITSKLFDDINCEFKYARDEQEFKIKTKIEHKKTNYAFLINLIDANPQESNFKGELEWGEKFYSIMANSSSKEIGRLKVEVHLDRIRDMNLEVWGTAKRFSNKCGVQFQWDANRDPSQQLILSYEFDKPKQDVYLGDILISYPDRTFNGKLFISNAGPYEGNLKISWNVDEAIDVAYSVGSEFKSYQKLWALFKVDTPFVDWKSNMINGSFYQNNNLVEVNFGIVWAESQRISFMFFLDYLLNDVEMFGEVKAVIESTINNIPIVTAHLRHNSKVGEVDSEILFKHNHFVSSTDRTFSLKSLWKTAVDEKYRNITGAIRFKSPLTNYSSGVLQTKFSLTKDREILGVIDVDIDARMYSFTIKGYMKKILDNMISFNLTTPIETFPYLLGRFGIIELKKYVIAELRTSNKSLGIELLYDFNSITDFDLKFYLALPQPAFERVMAIGKIKEDTIHIEGAWNKIDLGFKGVWRFLKYNDFEYSYLVFTPLKNFEENGLIIKFVAQTIQNFDIESSLKLGKHKIGLKGFGEPKTQIINELGLIQAAHVREDFQRNDDLDSDEKLDEAKVDIIDLSKYYSIIGSFELCTIVWRPVTGNYEIQQIDETFHGSAKILLPQGTVEVKNRFVLRGDYHFTNRLNINTPFKDYKLLSSHFKLKIPSESPGGFTIRLEFGASNGKAWKNYGFKIAYTLPKDPELKIHDVALIVLYPIVNTTRINITSRLELYRGSIRKALVSIDGFQTRFKMLGNFNQLQNNIDLKFGVQLNSPSIPNYEFNTYFSKKSKIKNQGSEMKAGFKYAEIAGEDSTFDTILAWREDKKNIIDGDLFISSNIFPISKFNTSVFITESNDPEFKIKILYVTSPSQIEEEMKFHVQKKGMNFEGDIVTPFSEYANIKFEGALTNANNGNYKAAGKISKNLSPHTFEGDVVMSKNMPTNVDLKIKSSNNNADTQVTYQLDFDELTRRIKGRISSDDQFLSFDSELYIQKLVDWAYNVKIESSNPQFEEVKLSTSLTPTTKTQLDASFEMITPWETLMINKINVSSIMTLSLNDGNFQLFYEIAQLKGLGSCEWKWIQRLANQNYMFKISNENQNKKFSSEISFKNSSKTPTDLVFDVDVNSLWTVSSRATFDVRNVRDMNLNYNLKLPAPVENDHKLTASYKGKHFPPRIENDNFADINVDYENRDVFGSLASSNSLVNANDITKQLNLHWGARAAPKKIDSAMTVKKVDEKSEYRWQLNTPYFEDEKTLDFLLTSFNQDPYKILHTTLASPESKQIAIGDIAFEDLSNMKGNLNSTLPILNITWFSVVFDFESKDEKTSKFINATWPENEATFISENTLTNDDGRKKLKGTVKAEMPLQTKHAIDIVYELEEQPLITEGITHVEYNTEKILKGQYKCKTAVLGADETRDTISFNVENKIWPVGINFIHHKRKPKGVKSEYSKKHIEIFDLDKEKRFNLTGEFTIQIEGEKQDYLLLAIHPNRTLKLTSQYDFIDEKTHQSSKIELARNIWLSYKVEVANKTTDEADGQDMKLKIAYPTRDITVGGNYNSKTDSLDANVIVEWEKIEVKEDTEEEETEDEGDESESLDEKKRLESSFRWHDKEYDNKLKDHQNVIIGLKHPAFDKDVTLQGSYMREFAKSSKLEIDFDYSDDPDHHAFFIADLVNLSEEVGYRNFTMNITASHPISDLEANFFGTLGLKTNVYSFEANGNYKKGYMGNRVLEMYGYLNSNRREVKYYRSTPNQIIDIYGNTKSNFPVYSIEGVFYDSPEYESAGVLELDISKRHVEGNVNFTESGNQNIQIHGKIPDTRSAVFNIWRNYDDVRIDDITYFVQMNHSRLITSKFKWRPKIRTEVKDWMRNFTTERYKAVTEDLDYWVKTIYSETKDSIKDIIENSDGHLRPFLDDLSSIKDIDEDLITFRNFLNSSYDADDFYIQSFTNYTMKIMTELAITEHIQQIPMFFKEMWVALGESSAAFKDSITWIVDTIKFSYKESMEIFNKLLQGNLLDKITDFLESLIEKYDAFAKELHVTFLQAIERIWDNFIATLNIYWNRILQNIEPQVLNSIHYVESFVWSVCNEVFDFVQNRTSELTESPYFEKVTNITHDLDILYQDLSNNDVFTNVKKYTGLFWQFLREKFVNLVPFGKEMKDFTNEIVAEFKELQKVEQVREAVQRYEEVQSSIRWLLNEFQFEKRLNMLIEILKMKLTRITQNALEAEDVYREAKTKFVFDPDIGIIDWEQKLPMAWHAFNETPQFEEIPEYRLMREIQDFFFTKNNNSIWSWYYDMKLLSEPDNLFPPFKAHAFLIGSRYVVTYDNENVNVDSKLLDDSCYHVLAHDFIDKQFTFLLKRKVNGKTLIVKSENMIEIELGNPTGVIKIGKTASTILPVSVGDLTITRDVNVLKLISTRGFGIICNLEFDVCSFHLSGWNFGKIAGIFGTITNEKFDDLMKSNNEIATNVEDFVESWKLTSTCTPTTSTRSVTKEDSSMYLCSEFFRQKTSSFSSCFTVVDPEPFYELCIESGHADKFACTAGIAYIEICEVQNIPLRVPESCVTCQHPNGSAMAEGSFFELNEDVLKPTVDIVILVESKSCNMVQSKRNLYSHLANSISNEMKNRSIDVKYSIVAFGGSAELESPQTVTLNGEIFTSNSNIRKFVNHLKEGNGTSDVFTTLTVASKIIFRPGSAKVFILSLCNKCDYNFLKFDFKSVSQLLQENDIILHVLSENAFNNKRVVGIDNQKAYVKKDQLKLLGDENLRQQITSFAELGQCAKLTLDVNGSIFTSNFNKKTESDYKTVANIFGKRIASGIKIKSCHYCECEGLNSGTAYMTCISCEKQSASNDYEMEDNFDPEFEDGYDDEL